MNHIPVGVSAFGDGDDFSRGAVGASCEHRRRFLIRGWMNSLSEGLVR